MGDKSRYEEGELTKRYDRCLSGANLEWLCLECGEGELN